MNFEEIDVAVQSSRRPSLVSLDNDSQVEDDDVDSDSDEDDSLHDDRSLSTESSAGRSQVCDDQWTDGTAVSVWHRMLHTLNKVGSETKATIKYLFYTDDGTCRQVS